MPCLESSSTSRKTSKGSRCVNVGICAEKAEMRRWPFVFKICGGQRGRAVCKALSKVMENTGNEVLAYYLNSLTGAVTWTKPVNLAKLKSKTHQRVGRNGRWQQILLSCTHRPYIWLSEEAATLLQRLYRRSKQASLPSLT